MSFWNDLSLRIKLTFSFLGLLTLILLVLGITLYVDNKNFLIKNLAIRVRAQAKPVISHWIFENKGAPPLLGKDEGSERNPDLYKIAPFLAKDLTSRDTGAIVLDRNGQILADGRILPEEPESAPPQPIYYKKALAGEKEVEYETFVKGHHVLVVLIPLKSTPVSENILGAVQLTTPLTQIDHILFRQRMALMTGIGLAILSGAVLGLLLTSSVLKGLTKMVATCQGIASGDLTQRVGLGRRGDEIGQLSAAFDHMADKIQASFESQRRFVANAAHELRTPLTAIRGSVEVLMRGAQDDPETASRLIQGIYRETRRLSSLCEKLLSLSKLDVSANIEKRPFKLEEFFSDLLPQIRASLKNGQSLQVKRGEPVRLLADPDLFAQVIINLIDNAVRHTPGDGQITLGWKRVINEIQVWVSDNGYGIHPEDIPHIFDPFFQGRHIFEDQRTHNHFSDTKDGGAGIGLALVDVIVKAHGWKIEVDSVPGRGTRFTIKIPI